VSVETPSPLGKGEEEEGMKRRGEMIEKRKGSARRECGIPPHS